MYSRHAIWCAESSTLVSRGPGLTVATVDSAIPDFLEPVLNIGISMLAKFIAVVVFSPIFLLPGLFAFVVGALLGQIYIKAQLSVKREMSNARSPVLSHFGAAIAGIGTYLVHLGGEYSLIRFFFSLHPCLLCPGFLQARGFASHRQRHTPLSDLVQLKQVDLDPCRCRGSHLLLRFGGLFGVLDRCYQQAWICREHRLLVEHGYWIQLHDLVVG